MEVSKPGRLLDKMGRTKVEFFVKDVFPNFFVHTWVTKWDVNQMLYATYDI